MEGLEICLCKAKLTNKNPKFLESVWLVSYRVSTDLEDLEKSEEFGRI